MTEDGPAGVVLQCVAAKAKDGREFVFFTPFDHRYFAERLAARVTAKGLD